jgi:phytoene synthase
MGPVPARIHGTRARSARPGACEAALAADFAHCRRVARDHAENFPVASFLLPRALRDPIAAIYAFARAADDFADEPRHEGNRIELLSDWEVRLLSAAAGPGEPPVFRALSETIRRHDLPLQPFRDLLSAFRQDALRTRYETWTEVLDYCQRSAAPIGRLVLHLFGHRAPDLIGRSDRFCAALQLTNFWQDLAVDAGRGRIYLPREDLRRHGVSEDSLRTGEAPRRAGFVPLMEEMAGRTAALFEAGRELPEMLPGRLRIELRLTWLGGTGILRRLRAVRFDVFRRRPALGILAWGPLLIRSYFPLAPIR